LIRFGFAKGDYQARPDDGLELIGAAITNAVRCVPPENKPTPAEINTCRPFLCGNACRAFPKLRASLSRWAQSHTSRPCKALGGRVAAASHSSMAAL
jgi:hypothetical protein